MATRPVVLLGDPVLRQEAREVEELDEGVRTLVRDLFETMDHEEGVGLAAPQVGVPLRVIVVDPRLEDDPEGGRIALVNPRIVEHSKARERGREGCLSIPGVDEMVERAVGITVEAMDLEGNPLELRAEGFPARVLQHEIDHLDGILYIDRISPLARDLVLKRYRRLREEEGGKG